MTQRRRLHLFVLIDALGWEILEGREFLSGLLPHRTRLRTVLGYSSGAIPTILTGKSPAEHGHWNLFYYDPSGSPFRWLSRLRFLPDSILDHRVTRKLLKEVGHHLLGLGPLFECCVSPHLLPWFNWVEKRNIYDCAGLSGALSIFDQLAEGGVPYRVYSYHRWTDREIFQQARRDLESGEASFLFLYFSELDRFLHGHCQEGGSVERQLSWYAAGLQGLFEAARRLDPKASFTVFSDHGMTPVKNSYDLKKQVDALGFAMPSEYLAVYDSTMARFWFFRDKARQEIVERLGTVPCGRILPDQELHELGIFFPDQRYGEVVFLLNPGWLLSSSDFNGHGWMPNGMHGYHPDDPSADAIFLSSERPPVAVRTIADIHEYMRIAAGLEKITREEQPSQ